jgi:hypothetical protein
MLVRIFNYLLIFGFFNVIIDYHKNIDLVSFGSSIWFGFDT